MPNTKDKTKAKEMLEKYAPEGTYIFQTLVGIMPSGACRRQLNIIDGVRDERWIVNINLYVGNLLGIRRDQFGNLVTRLTTSEIVDAISHKIGRKLHSSNI